MMGHLKNNLYVSTALQGGHREAVQVLFGPKISRKIFTYITHLFGLSRTRLNVIMIIVLYLTVWHGIALLVGAWAVFRKMPIYFIFEKNYDRKPLGISSICSTNWGQLRFPTPASFTPCPFFSR